MAFDAFISYSHAADGRLAPALQRGLQRLARPWYRTRALAVFHDETGLAVNPHLWASIARALDDSQWFIVLCSPDAAASEWTGREIDYWLEHKDPDPSHDIYESLTSRERLILQLAAEGHSSAEIGEMISPAKK